MQVPAEYANGVRELRDLYNVAEADLKNVGRVQNELIVTGVNQLRYAGQHLVRALAGEDDADIRGDLDAGIRHAKRAIYDINDSAIQYYVGSYRRFRSAFPRADLATIIGPDYHSAVKAYRDASEHLRITKDAQENRERFYEEARQHVQSMKTVVETLESYRDDVVRAINRHNRTRTTAWVSLAGNIVLALSTLGMVIAVWFR